MGTGYEWSRHHARVRPKTNRQIRLRQDHSFPCSIQDRTSFRRFGQDFSLEFFLPRCFGMLSAFRAASLGCGGDVCSITTVLAARKLSMASAVNRTTLLDTLTDSILRSLAHLKRVHLAIFSSLAASSAVNNCLTDMVGPFFRHSCYSLWTLPQTISSSFQQPPASICRVPSGNNCFARRKWPQVSSDQFWATFSIPEGGICRAFSCNTRTISSTCSYPL